MIKNGTTYETEAPELVEVLERVRQNGQRVRIHLGNPVNGEDWVEENGVEGRISRSTGEIKVPILLQNRNSKFGGAILESRIVKITTTTSPKMVLYQVENYKEPICKIKVIPECFDEFGTKSHPTHQVYINEVLRAEFNTDRQARAFLKKVNGTARIEL